MKHQAHKLIAKSILNNKFESDFSHKEIKWIYGGTIVEDYLSPTQRIGHWHFYRQNEDIPEFVGVCRPTSEIRLERLVKRLKKSSRKSKKRFITLGRIIHHIQDMSTPTHVIPIYHGPFKKDLYESYMKKHINADMITKNIDLNYHEKDFMQIYKSYAQETLKYLKNNQVPIKENPNNLNIKFDTIWTPYPNVEGKYKGFGEFGEYASCFNGLPSQNGIKIDIDMIYKYFTEQAAQSTYDALKYYLEKFKNKDV